MSRIVDRQTLRADISAQEMLEEYFFARRTYAPAAIRFDLTHWNQFGKMNSILMDLEKECGPVNPASGNNDHLDHSYMSELDDLHVPSTYAEELYLEWAY